MKNLSQVILLVSIFCFSSFVNAKVITVEAYHFTNDLNGIIKALKYDLGIQTRKLCPNSKLATVKSPEVKFSLGHPDQNRPLEGLLLLDTEIPTMDFPSHPFAILTVDVECR